MNPTAIEELEKNLRYINNYATVMDLSTVAIKATASLNIIEEIKRTLWKLKLLKLDTEAIG
jgi:hypothetical protein